MFGMTFEKSLKMFPTGEQMDMGKLASIFEATTGCDWSGA
jgi:hypothetical protein